MAGCFESHGAEEGIGQGGWLHGRGHPASGYQDRWCQAASNDLRQEERQEELEQLEEEVDALKERTAKAKELLRPGRLFRDSKLVPTFPVAGSTRN